MRRLLTAGLVLMTLACAGCPQYRDPTVPGEIRRVQEPTYGGSYFLYAPVGYDATKEYALIVIAHGTAGFDSAHRQIRDWVKLAEEKQIVVIAPELEGVSGFLHPSPKRQLELQRKDERHILSAVRQTRNAYRIARDKVFLVGWSGGSHAVLFTGLRNPDVFRALAVLQGDFRPEYLGTVAGSIDPHQPVYILYGSTDFLTGGKGEEMVRWLQEHGAAVTEEEVAGTHRNHPLQAYGFFERAARRAPWLHIRAYAEPGENPLTLHFMALSSFKPERYSWSFGDGRDSPIATPVHTYAREGTYDVTLTAYRPEGPPVERTVSLEVPQPPQLPLP